VKPAFLRECGGILVDNYDFDITIGDLKIDVKTKILHVSAEGTL
jgi:hypothetical protein